MEPTLTRPPGPSARTIGLRRFVFGLLVALTTAAASLQWLRTLLVNGFQPLEWPMFALLTVLVVPIAISFWTSFFGFLVQLRRRDELSLGRASHQVMPAELSGFRTAVVMPAYHEDVAQMFAGLKVTCESLERTGQLDHFDFHLLSDSTDPDAWIREEMAVDGLRREVSQPERIFYRNRRENIGRKAGNIAEFCASHGDNYRYMVVFDADSIMTGPTLLKLVQLMEQHPRAGIIQTPPAAVLRQSLFGRVLQFSTHAYSPTFLRGLNFWQAGEGNYWGHNAIIRLQPFIEHCRLPVLPGKEPLGGPILSHDFVEAALMRRAGWKVYVASDLRGSFESGPASLIEHATRDRRWCQGNLQHARLLNMPGLHWVSRLHLFMGVMAYVSSPLWVLLLFLSTAEGLRVAWTGHNYFVPDRSPFPVWEESIVAKAVPLFVSVMMLLILPKLLSLAAILLRKRRWVIGFGGRLRLMASVLSETLFSVLLAPVLAILHSRFVVGTLLGQNVVWAPQDRGEIETAWGEAVRRHAGITVLGAVWATLLFLGARELFWWFSPVLAGLVLSIPLSVWSSRIRWGQCARNRGIFLTPEEARPPRILRRFLQENERAARQPWARHDDGLKWILDDPKARSIHLSFIETAEPHNDPVTRHRLEGLRLKLESKGADELSPTEKRDLLWDASSVRTLAEWSRQTSS